MNKAPDIHQRLDELETHVTHQDSVIDELSEVSLKQWTEIKTLTDQLNHLTHKLQEVENGISSPPEEDVPPPHF